MNSKKIILVILGLYFTSCAEQSVTNNFQKATFQDSIFRSKNVKLQLQPSSSHPNYMLKSPLIVDDYPIDDTLLKLSSGMYFHQQHNYLDQSIFINKDLKQLIAYTLYTDYHRLEIIHFNFETVPEEFVKRLHVFKNRKNATSTKKEFINDFKNFGMQIDSSKFVSNKGFKLGASKRRAFSIYGTPTESKTYDHLEVYRWEFESDILIDSSRASENKRFAKDSFGHSITQFYAKEILVGQILENDIP